MDDRLPIFTLSQLALRNGTDRNEIWIAFKGMIYEVTHSRLWAKGQHYEHWAGQDMTEEIKEAPHSENVLKKFKIIGKLAI